MKKINILLIVFTVCCLNGCQTVKKTDFDEGYVSANKNFLGDNPYWSNNYRVNSSNYFSNRDFTPLGIYNYGM